LIVNKPAAIASKLGAIPQGAFSSLLAQREYGQDHAAGAADVIAFARQLLPKFQYLVPFEVDLGYDSIKIEG